MIRNKEQEHCFCDALKWCHRGDNKLKKNKFKRFFAFTLAETLIVMGIIGIVSALTLPNLNSSTGEKEKVAKVKKLYQNLNDAVGRATAVYGPIDEWKHLDSTATSQTSRFGERLTEFMKVSKNCGMESNKGCFAKITYELTASSGSVDMVFKDSATDMYKFILADGTSVIIQSNDNIVVDIDGPNKGKNKVGIDMFIFTLGDDKTSFLPYGYQKDFNTLLLNLNPIKSSSGTGGAAGAFGSTWVVNYDNMDYLKLTSDGKCPNGTKPTETNPRCK